jgi:Ni,Fe-hydrogenase III small subunit
MTALLGPRYADELRTRGIAVALSPRHADVVLVAGPLSRTAREPVMRLLESVPQPRALVAVGDCAINGCVFAGSPSVAKSAAEELDVNVEIGGCPPTPTAILDAIGEASQILASDAGTASADDSADDSDADADEESGVETLNGLSSDAHAADELDGEDA